MNSNSLTITSLIIIALLFNYTHCVLVSDCPNLCACDLTSTILRIQCTGTYTTFTLPDPNSNINLYSVDTIIIQNSNLQSFPTNLCSYNRIKTLDLSRNRISSNLTDSILSCLYELNNLNLSSNQIKFLSNRAFNFNGKLINLDLSSNQIGKIPLLLFPYKLDLLQTLNLKNNLITELDIWYFYLKSIQTLDLSNNLISTFKNDMNFTIDNRLIYPSLAQAQLVDLRNNRIEKFDDEILKLYRVCDELSFLFFIRLLYTMRLDSNPLQCNCTKSFNLVNFYKSLYQKNFFDTINNIFKASCTNSAYIGQSIFNFAVLNSDKDCLVDYAFGIYTCPDTTTTSTTTTSTTTTTTTTITTTTVTLLLIPQNLLNEPEKNITEINIDYFNDAQIAGYIIGILGILFLLILLIYCLCPIEILAVCFNCIPFFYSVCPCKSGVKREKEFDLFISYNRSNENWVRNKLIPFIRENYLIQNYILHYGEDNRSDEVFGSYIKGVMSKSSCILFILSDAFLMKEWNNKEFREHLRYLITREKTRFLAIQMHDICDEEVDEYFTEKLQIPRFISLENDEWLFWKKLSYFLYTNNTFGTIQPINPEPRVDYRARPNDDIYFDPHDIKRPIIHIPGAKDPYAHDNTRKDRPKVSSKPPKARTPRKPEKKKDKKPLLDEAPFQGISRLNTPMENRYEIIRLDNDYNPKDEISANYEEEFRIGLGKIKGLTTDRHVDSLVITKENERDDDFSDYKLKRTPRELSRGNVNMVFNDNDYPNESSTDY
ncbi:unnamed protein product [Brachionus calyciflorus]|uniref:TIR domain-containing protein n=1 Tax=Brachionus calyciflorus TaxID=104777 RepID=A0A814EYF3_9BILA|nr:unnamed protein product [Brachionus calyciflorus]